MFINEPVIDDVVLARRIARTWSGGVLLVGAFMLVFCSIVDAGHGVAPTRFTPAVILLGTWLVAFVTYRIALTFRPHVWNPDAFARSGIIVPSLGILALLPLTIHLPFFVLTDSVGVFGDWVATSAFVTAPTTLVAGILIAKRGRRLVEGHRATGVLRPWAIYGLGVAAVGPFWLLVVPGILVALTGLPFVPLMVYMEKLVAKERAIRNVGELPEALARFRRIA